MDILLSPNLEENFHTLLRRLGYGFERNRRTGEESYARRLAGGPFPRFHAYVVEHGKSNTPSPQPSPAEGRGRLMLRLHLDQKASSYEGSHAHSGEYDGALVEQEAARIRRFFGVK